MHDLRNLYGTVDFYCLYIDDCDLCFWVMVSESATPKVHGLCCALHRPLPKYLSPSYSPYQWSFRFEPSDRVFCSSTAAKARIYVYVVVERGVARHDKVILLHCE